MAHIVRTQGYYTRMLFDKHTKVEYRIAVQNSILVEKTYTKWSLKEQNKWNTGHIITYSLSLITGKHHLSKLYLLRAIRQYSTSNRNLRYLK